MGCPVDGRHYSYGYWLLIIHSSILFSHRFGVEHEASVIATSANNISFSFSSCLMIREM